MTEASDAGTAAQGAAQTPFFGTHEILFAAAHTEPARMLAAVRSFRKVHRPTTTCYQLKCAKSLGPRRKRLWSAQLSVCAPTWMQTLDVAPSKRSRSRLPRIPYGRIPSPRSLKFRTQSRKAYNKVEQTGSLQEHSGNKKLPKAI